MVDSVCSTGIRPPSPSRRSDSPGWQSTKYSPISDCGRISQCASLRRVAKPGSVTLALTTALVGYSLVSFSFSVTPARTPAMRKSPPP